MKFPKELIKIAHRYRDNLQKIANRDKRIDAYRKERKLQSKRLIKKY